MNAICRPHSMCGCAACSCPFAFHDRHTGAFSCAIPISATAPSPPARGGVDVRAGDLFLVLTLPEVDHRHALSFAQRCTSAT